MASIYLTIYMLFKHRDYVCDSQKPARFAVSVMKNYDIL